MLTDVAIRSAKGLEKPYKLFDGGGLYVLVKPDGSKYWRLKYRFAGKEKLLAIGVYGRGNDGTINASAARSQRDRAKQALRDGRDPSADRKEQRRILKASAAATFEAIAREWLKPENRPKKNPWTEDHADRVRASLEIDVFPHLGCRPINEIKAPELLAVLKKIQARGALETAQRVLQRCGKVFGFAMAHGFCDVNPAVDANLGDQLQAPERTNRAFLKKEELPAFLHKLDAYDGHALTRLALKLQVLTWVRPGELRAAEWSEFDLEQAQWLIPAERMKMRLPHIVPLSRQALEVLRELQQLTGEERYLFPNQQKAVGYMSENTMLYALYRMGYHSRATGHGFRSTASTILNEQRIQREDGSRVRRWHEDAIERQLAHQERNKVRGAYNHAEYIEERTEMMQAWADYVDAAAGRGNVRHLHRKAS
jgi:integrase